MCACGHSQAAGHLRDSGLVTMSNAGVTRRHAAHLLVIVPIVLACCALATMGSREAGPSALLQEGIFTPGVQETFAPPGGGRQQSLLAGYAAMGTVGGGEHGLHDVPPPPPPTWSRGGHSWVYDGIYGNGQRPTTGIWANKGFEAPPAPNDGGVQEQDSVPTQEPAEQAAVAPAPAAPSEPAAADFAEPPAQGAAPAGAEEAPASEVVVEGPNGQEEVVEEPAAAAQEEAAQAAQEEGAQEQAQEPAQQAEGCDGEEDCGGPSPALSLSPPPPSLSLSFPPSFSLSSPSLSLSHTLLDTALSTTASLQSPLSCNPRRIATCTPPLGAVSGGLHIYI